MSGGASLVRPRDLLAFVHIEKAAGTSMIHLLRRNFCCRYFDARPMTGRSGNFFTADDLRLALRIHPGLRCIGGHTVRPTDELFERMPWIRYFTLLRDPVERYYSHYRYWVRQMGQELTLAEFLEKPLSWNFQTVKIAGSQDVERAKRILSERFLVAGLVEELDESLVLLRRALDFCDLDIDYAVANRGVVHPRDREILERHRSQIAAVNALDVELYAHVRDVLLPRYRARLSPDLETELRAFRAGRRPQEERSSWRMTADKMFRHFWLNPVVGLIRVRHGLPASGSYGY